MIKQTHCPTCRKQVDMTDNNAWRPFCSERCRLIDLGEWMNDSRRIPSGETVPDATYPQEPEIKH